MSKNVIQYSDASVSIDQAPVHIQRFSIQYTYPVYFVENLFAGGNGIFLEAVSRCEPTRRHRCVFFIDSGVAHAWPNLSDDIAEYHRSHATALELVSEPMVVPGGEGIKNDPALVERLHHHLFDLGIDRQSFVVAIGGGAVLDAVGFVAATTHRGVRHIRVPTTVLAQNDSGVGVKSGVNAFGVKNFVGAFAPPFAVLNDFSFLRTLEPRDKVAGMAEAIKVGLIRDSALFRWIEDNAGRRANFEDGAVAYLVRRCAELHMTQIAGGGDPFESGNQRPLDYGHWAAHKLESLTKHELRHGEAVAMGMALDSRYATQIGLLRSGEQDRVCALLESLGLKLWHPAMDSRAPDGRLALLAGLADFREHLGGDLS
ncbi:MAG: 3-dehydroquinate synthase, partial [Gammaproteobacteria bacterium]|nr:3-dehydroquinate synthase [Gammaproteobacteria bacterium]